MARLAIAIRGWSSVWADLLSVRHLSVPLRLFRNSFVTGGLSCLTLPLLLVASALLNYCESFAAVCLGYCRSLKILVVAVEVVLAQLLVRFPFLH